ncbi:MAG: polymorphic toxin type 33 domain-containing protein, partial [Halobacteriovoraceae bacterium]|nr:polymorphic toxin type 33 domain-containing protein [Halobacteriovoraceae bacterium]
MYLNERLQDKITENWDGDYNSSIGRFISEDPLGLEGEDFNLYRYADNRVLGFSDPFGLNSLVGGYPRFQRGRFGGGGIVVGLPFVFTPPQAPISDPNVFSKGDERKMGDKELKDLGIDAEELKESLGAKPSGKFDLFLDKKTGEILVKPKRGNGPGEPTGLNIKDLRQI